MQQDEVSRDPSTNPLLHNSPEPSRECSNSVNHGRIFHLGHPASAAIFGTMLFKLQIRECRNEGCANAKRQMDLVAPPCEWTHFRDWAVTVMSCARYSSRNDDPRNAAEAAVQYCVVALMHGFRLDDFPPGVDMFGVCEVIYWMTTASPSSISPDKIRRLWDGDELTLPAIRNAVQGVQNQNVCQSRLWNLIMATERKVVDLPSILSLMSRFQLPLGHQAKHRHCTAETCLLAHDNATMVEQLHIACDGQQCNERYFPPERIHELNRLVHPDFTPTAWAISRQQVDSVCERYMAISHVWSDGTGVGLKAPGHVNDCLFRFFSNVATELGCDGIWWDAICVPATRREKNVALRKMNENFSRAACTLVHDRELVNFEWKDDGSPCIALALSTWFTRSWTALELWASPSVKVLFRKPHIDGGGLVIKDLDMDILIDDKNSFHHPAHVAVSKVIGRIRTLRTASVGTLEWDLPLDQLLAILKPRYTSWDHDRIVIAGLMANIERVDSAWSQLTLTKSILGKLRVIRGSSLLHGHATIHDSGPWSWCPPSLFELRVVEPSNSGWLSIEDGIVTGVWRRLRMTQQLAEMQQPFGDHVYVVSKITTALRNWQKCSLLRPREYGHSKRFDRHVLTMQLGQSGKWEHHRYIGTVIGRVDFSGSSLIPVKLQ